MSFETYSFTFGPGDPPPAEFNDPRRDAEIVFQVPLNDYGEQTLPQSQVAIHFNTPSIWYTFQYFGSTSRWRFAYIMPIVNSGTP